MCHLMYHCRQRRGGEWGLGVNLVADSACIFIVYCNLDLNLLTNNTGVLVMKPFITVQYTQLYQHVHCSNTSTTQRNYSPDWMSGRWAGLRFDA